MAVRNEPTPEGTVPGEVAIEREAIRIAIEKADVLATRLIEKLHPVLNVEAFSTKKGEEGATPLPAVCSLATDIRRDMYVVRDSISNKLAELLRFIEL